MNLVSSIHITQRMGLKRLNVEYGAISGSNVEMLRRINTSCFPVSYNDIFYRDVVKRNNEHLDKFAYWNGLVVGAVCARIEALPDEGRSRLYIMTLGVLAAYRGRQVGTQLIQSLLDYYEERKDSELADVDEIALHVHIHNEDAIKFYADRFDFEKGDLVENYYNRIDPPHCYLLYKKLR